MEKKKVVIGFLGTQLDSGRGAGRWEKWRPTLSLMQHEDLVVERLELLYTPPHLALAQLLQRSEEHTSELQSHSDLVCRLLLEKKKKLIANIVLIPDV